MYTIHVLSGYVADVDTDIGSLRNVFILLDHKTHMGVASWLDNSSDYTCPECEHETFIAAMGGPGLKLRCNDYKCDCYPSCYILVQKDYSVEETVWTLPDGSEAHYRCPECGGDVERIHHSDGMGYVDVQLECMSCGESSWE